MLRITSILILTLALAAPAQAGLKEGVDAYDRGDYATALREFRPLAEQGDAIAQYSLGVMYDEGYGAPENDAEAVKWYQLSAEQGFATAQFNLGGMFSRGLSPELEREEALVWLAEAAQQGHRRARLEWIELEQAVVPDGASAPFEPVVEGSGSPPASMP